MFVCDQQNPFNTQLSLPHTHPINLLANSTITAVHNHKLDLELWHLHFTEKSFNLRKSEKSYSAEQLQVLI